MPSPQPSLCLHSALFLPSEGLGYKEEEFSWSQYLRSTRAQAAPKHLFVSQSHVSALSQSEHLPWGQRLQLAEGI